MTRTCKHCGSENIEEDASRGDTVCTDCGAVLEQSAIVSDVQFAETGGGGASLIGQYVASDGTHRLGIAGLKAGSRDSREQTIRNAKSKINQVANQLRLNNSMQEMALSLFTQALYRHLTKGRRTHHVAAACLYIACRSENHHLLLLDFSDAVQVNVYALGRVVHTFCLRLFINLPPTDPCTYVMRFAHKLQFGDREHEVASVAMRLVQRMKRDWIATGRRPTGVCGAALLLAARYHEINRTISDVVRVVHVGDSVVRKRLTEFANTASAGLTLDEFAEIDLEQEADPPSYYIHRHTEIADSLSRDLPALQHEMEAAIEEQSMKRLSKGPYAKFAAPTEKGNGTKNSVAIKLLSKYSGLSGDAGQFFAEELLESVQTTDNNATNSGDAIASSSSSSSADNRTDPQTTTPVPTPLQNGSPQSGIESASNTAIAGPTMASLGIDAAGRQQCEMADRAQQELEREREMVGGALDLSGIDDDEIDGYILSEPEVKVKERLWMAAHGTFLEEMQEKRRLKLEQEEADDQAPKKKRRRRKEPIQAATGLEAMHKVLQEKKLSSKINWEALRKFEPSTANGSDEATSSAAPPNAADVSASAAAQPNVDVKKLEVKTDSPKAKVQKVEQVECKKNCVEKGDVVPSAGLSEQQNKQSDSKLDVKPKSDNAGKVPANARRRPAIRAKVNLAAAGKK